MMFSEKKGWNTDICKCKASSGRRVFDYGMFIFYVSRVYIVIAFALHGTAESKVPVGPVAYFCLGPVDK